MKVKELISELQKFEQESEVITGCWNKYTNTYGVVDHCWKANYEEIAGDFYGIPGKIDSRLLSKSISDFVFVGSEFPYKHGEGDDDINYPIEEINGPNGDPDIIWKLNGFTFTLYYQRWEKPILGEDGRPCGQITYAPAIKRLHVHNYKMARDITLYKPGIEDLRNAVELCKLDIHIVS